MGKSQCLRHQDLRNLYLLLGECCELGADPLAWRRHMIESISRLLDADVVSYGEGEIAGQLGTPGWLRPMMTISYGWPSESDQRIHDRVFQEGKIEVIPWMSPEHCRKFWRPRRGTTTISRTQFFTKRQWDGCQFYQDYARPAHCGEWVDTTHVMKDGHVRGLALFRSLEAKPFEVRGCNWLSLFMQEHSGLLGTKLATFPGLSILEFPPRQQDVLCCLMEGDGTKQIADKLGISRHTVHYHIKELHRRFGVVSRGELLAATRAYWPALRNERRPLPK